MTDFRETLADGAICLDLRSDTKQGLIEEMVDLLVESGQVTDREAVLKAILEREAKMSTGMQSGVAVPHGKTDAVEDMVTALGIKKKGIDFDSLDGESSFIFIMTVSPVNRTGPHITYLGEISKYLNSPSIRERLIAATDIDGVLNVFSE